MVALMLGRFGLSAAHAAAVEGVRRGPMLVWALDEVVRGASPSRRAFGGETLRRNSRHSPWVEQARHVAARIWCSSQSDGGSAHIRHGLEADVGLGELADLALGRDPRSD